MTLIWHIVRKDMTRLRTPLAAWLVFIFGTMLLYAVSDIMTIVGGASEFRTGRESVSAFVGVAAVLIEVSGVLLAAMMVTDDPAGSSRAFWATRPLAGIRLLVAKALAAVLFFVVSPTVVLLPIWIGQGFGTEEVLAIATWWMALRAMITLGLFVVAAVAGTLARFLAGIVLLVAVAILFAVSTDIADGAAGKFTDVAESASYAAIIVGAVGTGFVLWRQYAGPRRPAWIAVAAAVAAVFSVRILWSWDITIPPVAPFPKPSDLHVRFARVHSDAGIRFDTTLSPAQVGEVVLVPNHADLRSKAESSRGGLWLQRAPTWNDEVVLRTVAGGKSREGVAWRLDLGGSARATFAGFEPADWTGVLRIGVVKVEQVWELPLRVGSSDREGSSYSEIVDVRMAKVATPKRRLVLAEKAAKVETERMPWTRPRSADARVRQNPEDFFVVAHRERGEAWVVQAAEFSAVELHGMERRWRALEYAPPTGVDVLAWEQGASLIKVRFVPVGSFQHEVKPEMFQISTGGVQSP